MENSDIEDLCALIYFAEQPRVHLLYDGDDVKVLVITRGAIMDTAYRFPFNPGLFLTIETEMGVKH
ncbi:MAG: hypothetical protein A3F15_02565 [Candidatus Wildermuthbacteria bacterium RIFCSPHIGHO2_12_FULL_40_12]|uniref:Uncharacterized protein n=1 Tax=Candidatus Wildermuthbacteria bacterium RIFCSPHIGHO2_12_FULL_40_12 TaxID=1802457 RepID=A0A1G2REZ0_9BACT|nr:MAG: hypothetical protein A3F15_02565 [Candidatus Wildermuthbacteria bacterium RIFCSPHIGHO2_12_FULL_40_12]